MITLFSAQSEVFDEAEVGVLLELTANLGFALQYLEKDEAVHFLSYFDSLTGLAKRPLFCQRLAQLLSADAATATAAPSWCSMCRNSAPSTIRSAAMWATG